MLFKIVKDQVRENLIREVKSLPLNKHEVEIRDIKNNKTDAQRRYWHSCMSIVADFIGIDMEQLKREIKKSLGQYKVVEVEGEKCIELFSSEQYNKKEYSRAIEATVLMAAHLNVKLPQPDYYGLDCHDKMT